MKKVLLLSGFASLGILVLPFIFADRSQAEVIISSAKIAAIRTHCVENQATLNQLRQTDAFLRINRGNLYRTVSDKLMTPLNNQITASKLDATLLTAITAKFDAAYKTFYADYITYDTNVSKLSTINCTKAPVSFYNALIVTREARQQLAKSNQLLVQLAQDYKTQFDQFKMTFEKGMAAE